MAKKRPATIAEYIDAAPKAGQPQLRKLRALLRKLAPDAQEAIKWGQAFYIEPRFVFSFSALKGHVSFAPVTGAMVHFAKELEKHDTTKYTMRIPYDAPLPTAMVTKLAKYSVASVKKRKTEGFWA